MEDLESQNNDEHELEKLVRGGANREAGNDFEKRIEPSFVAYAKIGRAYLDFMPVPTRVIGKRGGMKFPVRVADGKAPFDVYGYAPKAVQVGSATFDIAVFVGAELKSSNEPQTSLPIVKPDNHAKGLAYHQLEALALVARMGGIARVVWDNGGEVGILGEAQILHHHLVYEASRRSEEAGRGKGKVGSRSIPWASFQKVKPTEPVGGAIIIDWLILGEVGVRRAA